MATEKQLETTSRARELQSRIGDVTEMAEITGISRATIFNRYRNNEWKRIEMIAIDSVYSNYSKIIDIDLPAPKSQVQEVLFELIRRDKIDRPLMMNECGVWGLTARISNLRYLYGYSFITSNENIGENKHGREIKFFTYSLKDREEGIKAYLEMNSKYSPLRTM